MRTVEAMRDWFRGGALVVLLSLGGACSTYEGTCVPKDPGDVSVRVRDQSGHSIHDVWVEIWEIPNCVGSTYGIGLRTNALGEAVFRFIPAGNVRIEITVPTGFTAPEGSVRRIDVINGATVTAQFNLNAR